MTPQKPSAQESASSRKSWVPKTPAQVVLEQITRQENRVQALRDELAHEEHELGKLQNARKALEAQ